MVLRILRVRMRNWTRTFANSGNEDLRLPVPSAEIHDAFRRVPGSYDWTLRAVHRAREIGLPAQINTTITRHNSQYLDSMIALLDFSAGRKRSVKATASHSR